MKRQKVFISSVQKEFAEIREALWMHFLSDPLLSSFYEPVIFEKLPADAHPPDRVYLSEVAQSSVYLILLGTDYGYEDANGVSPTEHEYDHAAALYKTTLAFIKGGMSDQRHPKETRLIEKMQEHVSYKRFHTTAELLFEVNKALVALLKHLGLIQVTDFDASFNATAAPEDISGDKVAEFMALARNKRGFPLREGSAPSRVLAHLNMQSGERLTNSALLAFASDPQRFFPSAIVKCAHFHGYHVEKPIPDHKVLKGDVFMQVDQAVDFVLSKISVAVGMRNSGNQAPVSYEMPRAVIAEAIVNAVAHRDYNSNGSVQLMLFADRLEISNPGGLTPELTIDKLKTDHASYPVNPVLAEVMYQAGYIERFGTGTGEIIRLTEQAGLREPDFDLEEGFKVTLWRPATAAGQATGQATGQVTGQADEEVKRVLLVMDGELRTSEIMGALDLKHREYFRDAYLLPAIAGGFIEMTVPDKPNSPNQKYRLTADGILLKGLLGSK
ncbi:hypothetical protein FNO01nite_26220 [Flavobacterium noncentrifugens]|uniref:ATP-dependent DNA helicase recG C-terminal n=1 Tax=Flavobacterium noncentrifugens TaxID=1128970 RepID=A0A1G8ZFW8_9FLAO|nr:ATP-binding protein [Flavobacterium noncentrifugens]GEP51950.1 hypothetical protein FNO01nite_26220 [Flavobacterium noncentrifugens]SDK14002.1 protein of unknown function [Flavobacterium noncentrifugens]